MAADSARDSYLSGGEPAEGRSTFVSRSRPEAPGRTPLMDADGRPLVGLGNRGLLLLLSLVAILQAISWWVLEGYQLADSVEYMERAFNFARQEEMIDSQAIRSFGFSSLLVPFFFVADQVLGLDDLRPLVWVLRLFQMFLGLCLVVVCTRIGARLGGRSTGYAAGFLCGVNPVFLQYTVSPVSGVAAALFVGLGLESLLERRGFRRAMVGGAWLGLAFLMAYKTIIIILPIAALVFLRDRFKHFRSTAGLASGVSIAVLVQIALDKLSYGRWGASLVQYLIENFVHLFAKVLLKLGFEEWGVRVYAWMVELQGEVYVRPSGPIRESLMAPPRDFGYLSSLPQILVWPVILFAVLGFWRAYKRANWKTSIVLLVVVANIALLSVKRSQSYRLWIPLLPMIAPVCALGWATIHGLGVTGRGAWRGALSGLLMLAALGLGMDTLLALNTRRFGVYWEAMDMINVEAERSYAERASLSAPGGVDKPPKVRVSAAYHWAMYLRESPIIDLVKLPHHLDSWKGYEPHEQQSDFETIESLEWFVTHLPVLTLDPALMRAFNQHFEVYGAFYHQDVWKGLGPIFVLRERDDDDPHARLFYEALEGADPDAWRRRHQLGRPIQFVATWPDGPTERLSYLGYEFDSVPGNDYGWITHHWYAHTDIHHDYTLIDRITAPDAKNSWQNNHQGAYGSLPTSRWKAGSIVRESFLVVPAQEAYGKGGLARWMGGPYRRGDLIPVKLWMGVELRPEGQLTGRMVPCRPGSDEPVRAGELASAYEVPGGYFFSKDDLVQVGSFLMPVHLSARAHDDGKPIE